MDGGLIWEHYSALLAAGGRQGIGAMERLEEEAGKSALESGSVLREAGPLVDKVNRARLELLDLSTRNRLLNTPRSGRAKTVEVINELAKVMYQTLVIDGKRFTFIAGRAEPTQVEEELPGLSIELTVDGEPLSDFHEGPEDPELLAQPDLELDEHGRVVSQWDAHLTTRFTPTGLQKRLLDLYIDARTLQEEQGINVLYLAIGYLKWRAPGAPKVDRYAPLVLVPVALERSNAGEKFHLRWQGDEIQANLSLQLFLQRQFGHVPPSRARVCYTNNTQHATFLPSGGWPAYRASWSIARSGSPSMAPRSSPTGAGSLRRAARPPVALR